MASTVMPVIWPQTLDALDKSAKTKIESTRRRPRRWVQQDMVWCGWLSLPLKEGLK